MVELLKEYKLIVSDLQNTGRKDSWVCKTGFLTKYNSAFKYEMLW